MKTMSILCVSAILLLNLLAMNAQSSEPTGDDENILQYEQLYEPEQEAILEEEAEPSDEYLFDQESQLYELEQEALFDGEEEPSDEYELDEEQQLAELENGLMVEEETEPVDENYPVELEQDEGR